MRPKLGDARKPRASREPSASRERRSCASPPSKSSIDRLPDLRDAPSPEPANEAIRSYSNKIFNRRLFSISVRSECADAELLLPSESSRPSELPSTPPCGSSPRALLDLSPNESFNAALRAAVRCSSLLCNTASFYCRVDARLRLSKRDSAPPSRVAASFFSFATAMVAFTAAITGSAAPNAAFRSSYVTKIFTSAMDTLIGAGHTPSGLHPSFRTMHVLAIK